jgi:hypothetical protein
VTSGATTARTLTFHYPTIKNTSKPTVRDTDVIMSNGKWSPTPSRYHYDWLRDGKVIHSSYLDWYDLSKADIGHRIKVCATASRPGTAHSRACSNYSRTIKRY